MTTFRSRCVAAVATTLVLAGCGDPTASVTAPDTRPSFDGGGYTFGGGHNRSDSTTTTTTATFGAGTAVSGGGYSFGGGH